MAGDIGEVQRQKGVARGDHAIDCSLRQRRIDLGHRHGGGRGPELLQRDRAFRRRPEPEPPEVRQAAHQPRAGDDVREAAALHRQHVDPGQLLVEHGEGPPQAVVDGDLLLGRVGADVEPGLGLDRANSRTLIDGRDQGDIGDAVAQLEQALVAGDGHAAPIGVDLQPSAGVALHLGHPGDVGPAEGMAGRIGRGVAQVDRRPAPLRGRPAAAAKGTEQGCSHGRQREQPSHRLSQDGSSSAMAGTRISSARCRKSAMRNGTIPLKTVVRGTSLAMLWMT